MDEEEKTLRNDGQNNNNKKKWRRNEAWVNEKEEGNMLEMNEVKTGWKRKWTD